MSIKHKGVWEAIFLVGLGIMPWVFWPWADVAYEVPRVWWVMGWVWALWLVGTGLPKKSLDVRAVRWGLALLIVMIAASWFGVDWGRSLAGNYYRWDGLVTYGSLALLAMMVGWWVDGRLWKIIAMTVALSSMGLSIVALGQWWWGDTSRWGGDTGVSFGNPNLLAGYLVAVYGWVVSLGGRMRMGRWWAWVLVPVAGVLATGSRAAGLILGIFWVWFYWKSVSSRIVHFSLGLVALAIIGLGIWGWWVDKGNPALVFMPESRERVVRKLVLGWWERPWLGYGWANVDKAFSKVDWPYRVLDDVYVDKAHSSGLEYLVSTGIVGLALYLGFLGVVGKRLFGEQALVWRWGLVLYLLAAQANVVSVGTEVVFSLLVGRALQAPPEPLG